MKLDPKDYRVREGDAVELRKWPTTMPPAYPSKARYNEFLAAHSEKLSALQELLYASEAQAVLLIFQGMDAAGKDGVIKHVMSGVNPQGCRVVSFKQPSPTELRHDFLWRTTRELPERGQIGIFNRSYYEDVLVARVHPEMLRHDGAPGHGKGIWRDRYRSIVDFEAHLARNGTRVVKFFLHLSNEEQRCRFLNRIDQPEKNWKFSAADIEERAFWKSYIDAYERCLRATSTTAAPWFVVPADDKPNARLIVSAIVVHALESIKMSYPASSDARLADLAAYRERLSE